MITSFINAIDPFISKAIGPLKVAAANPFGIDVENHGSKFSIPVGSALNCLGYNDYLERTVGVVRAALGLLVMAYSKDRYERGLAAAHIFRGILEMNGSFEGYLLIADMIGTAYNIAKKSWKKEDLQNAQDQLTKVINASGLPINDTK